MRQEPEVPDLIDKPLLTNLHLLKITITTIRIQKVAVPITTAHKTSLYDCGQTLKSSMGVVGV
jgi:hypothetical protein